jgi:hypothetical protein
LQVYISFIVQNLHIKIMKTCNPDARYTKKAYFFAYSHFYYLGQKYTFN